VLAGAIASTLALFVQNVAYADSPTIHRSVLSNGLKVIVIPDDRVPFVGMSIDYGFGYAQDPPGKQGLTALTWNMAHDTTLHVSSGQVDDLLSGAGATKTESNSAMDYSYNLVHLPSNSVALPLWLWSDTMGFFVQSLSQNALDKHRELLRTQYQTSVLNTPCGRCMDFIRRELFPASHPYANARLASPDTMNAITLDDLRDLHPKLFNPANAVLAIAGNVDEAQLLPLIRRYFEPIPSQPVPPRVNPDQTIRGETRITVAANIPHPVVKVAWATPGLYSDDDLALDVLSELLRGGVTNLLNWRIKQQQLANAVWASQGSLRDRSVYRIEAEVADGIAPEQVLEAIDGVIGLLKTQGISPAMTSGAVNGALLDYGSESFTQSYRARSTCHWQLVTGRNANLDDRLAVIGKVTPETLVNVVKRHFGPNRVVLVATPDRGAPLAGELRSVARMVQK